MESHMGESNRRRKDDPLYGIVPKTGVLSPLWVVHSGVLFLVGQGDSIACLPASNMVIPNVEQLRVLEDILNSNPSLLNQTVDASNDVTTSNPRGVPSNNDAFSGTIDMNALQGYIPTQVTTIPGTSNLMGPYTVDLL